MESGISETHKILLEGKDLWLTSGRPHSNAAIVVKLW